MLVMRRWNRWAGTLDWLLYGCGFLLLSIGLDRGVSAWAYAPALMAFLFGLFLATDLVSRRALGFRSMAGLVRVSDLAAFAAGIAILWVFVSYMMR